MNDSKKSGNQKEENLFLAVPWQKIPISRFVNVCFDLVDRSCVFIVRKLALLFQDGIEGVHKFDEC